MARLLKLTRVDNMILAPLPKNGKVSSLKDVYIYIYIYIHMYIYIYTHMLMRTSKISGPCDQGVFCSVPI